jgi:hypothetical protein
MLPFTDIQQPDPKKLILLIRIPNLNFDNAASATAWKKYCNLYVANTLRRRPLTFALNR